MHSARNISALMAVNFSSVSDFSCDYVKNYETAHLVYDRAMHLFPDHTKALATFECAILHASKS